MAEIPSASINYTHQYVGGLVMPKLEVWRGEVSGAESSTNTFSMQTTTGSERVNSSQQLSFLVSGKPAIFSGKIAAPIRNGDDVVIAGFLKNGQLFASAFKNNTNGSYQYAPEGLMLLIAVLTLVMGVAMLIILIGVLILAMSAYFFYMWYNIRRVNGALRLATG